MENKIQNETAPLAGNENLLQAFVFTTRNNDNEKLKFRVNLGGNSLVNNYLKENTITDNFNNPFLTMYCSLQTMINQALLCNVLYSDSQLLDSITNCLEISDFLLALSNETNTIKD